MTTGRDSCQLMCMPCASRASSTVNREKMAKFQWLGLLITALITAWSRGRDDQLLNRCSGMEQSAGATPDTNPRCAVRRGKGTFQILQTPRERHLWQGGPTGRAAISCSSLSHPGRLQSLDPHKCTQTVVVAPSLTPEGYNLVAREAAIKASCSSLSHPGRLQSTNAEEGTHFGL